MKPYKLLLGICCTLATSFAEEKPATDGNAKRAEPESVKDSESTASSRMESWREGGSAFIHPLGSLCHPGPG